jgi:hypothetical protein
MIRADWNKRRLGRVEAQLYRTIFAETSGSGLGAALLSDSPANKLLARVQRHLAAFERAWYRAYREIHRGRRDAEAAEQAAFAAFLDRLLPASPYKPLASFPEIPASRPAETLSNPALRL